MTPEEIYNIWVKIKKIDDMLVKLDEFISTTQSQPNPRFIDMIILRYYELHKERFDINLSLFGDSNYYHSISEETFEYDANLKDLFIQVANTIKSYLLNKKSQLEDLLNP